MRAVEQQDELEIETRLRAALQARSELVTHSTLRPGIPPNEHTAGVARGGRGVWWSWRRLWVPVTVAAALAGGVFVGAQLPSDSGNSGASPAAGGPGGTVSTAGVPGGTSTGTAPSSAPNVQAAGSPQSVGSVAFTLADGWQVTQTSATSACVTLKTNTNPKPTTAGAGSGASAALPCGVDGLYVKTDAVATAWPLSTATKDTGWSPASTSSGSDLLCPTAKPGSSEMVKDSMLLRSTAKYELADQTGQASPVTADYHEWAVVCDSGHGVKPMLWKLNAAPGAAAPATFTIATVVSADPQYDSALLGMVGSLHPSS